MSCQAIMNGSSVRYYKQLSMATFCVETVDMSSIHVGPASTKYCALFEGR